MGPLNSWSDENEGLCGFDQSGRSPKVVAFFFLLLTLIAIL